MSTNEHTPGPLGITELIAGIGDEKIEFQRLAQPTPGEASPTHSELLIRWNRDQGYSDDTILGTSDRRAFAEYCRGYRDAEKAATPSAPITDKDALVEAAEEFLRRWEGTGFGEYSHEDLAEKFRAAISNERGEQAL